MSDALGKLALIVGAFVLAWEHVLRAWATSGGWQHTAEISAWVENSIHAGFWGLVAHAVVGWSSIENRYAEVAGVAVFVLYLANPGWWWWPL